METLSDDDVERLLEQHKSEQGGGDPENNDHVSGDGTTEEVGGDPSEDHDDSNLFHFGRIEDVFDLFDTKNNAVETELIKQKNPKNFIQADEALLVKVRVIQCGPVNMTLTFVTKTCTFFYCYRSSCRSCMKRSKRTKPTASKQF